MIVRLWYLAAAIILSEPCLSLTLPLNYSGLAFPTNSSTALTTIPEAFDYYITTYSTESPIDKTAAWVTLLAAMSDLAYLPQSQPLTSGRTWSLSSYNLGVIAKCDEIEFAVWGIFYLSERMFATKGKLYPMTIDTAWDGAHVGVVHIAAIDDLASGVGATNVTAMGNAGTNMTASIVAGENAGVQYLIASTGDALTLGNVFRVAMTVLADSAGIGVGQPFVSFRDDEMGFSFTAMNGADGKTLMTEGDLMRTVEYVAWKMFGDNKFEEADIQVLKGGKKIGGGRLSAPRRVAIQ